MQLHSTPAEVSSLQENNNMCTNLTLTNSFFYLFITDDCSDPCCQGYRSSRWQRDSCPVSSEGRWSRQHESSSNRGSLVRGTFKIKAPRAPVNNKVLSLRDDATIHVFYFDFILSGILPTCWWIPRDLETSTRP